MAKFQTTKQKIRKLWEKTFSNSQTLKNLDNTDQLDSLNSISKNQTFKKIRTIYDSGEIPATIGDISDISTGTKTVTKNEKLPHSYTYAIQSELDIPEQFLPFIKVVPEIKSIPNTQIATNYTFVATQYTGDNIKITGDGATLYEGAVERVNESEPRVNKLLSFFEEDELEDFSIPEGNTKKVFQAEIEYISSGDQFKIIGPILRLKATFDLGGGCGSNTNKDIYDCLSFRDFAFAFENHDNEFLSLTSSGFSMTAEKEEVRWTGTPPACSESNTIIDGVSVTDSFGSAERVEYTVLGQLFKLVDGEYEFQGNNEVAEIDTDDDTIISQSYTDIGRRVYYSSATQGILSVLNTGNDDGSFEEIKLVNFPNVATLGHVNPYSQIKLLRNQDPFPNEIEETQIIGSSQNTFKNFLRINEDKYILNFIGTFLVLVPATLDDPNRREFPVYDDTYTVVSDVYTLTTENHSISSKTTYIVDPPDIIVRIRVYLQNPLYWKEERRYDV